MIKKNLRKILKELLATIIEDINRFIRSLDLFHIPSKNKKEYGKLNYILINGIWIWKCWRRRQLSSNIERWKKKIHSLR